MPRPKATFPKVQMHVALPQETVARLRLMFYTDKTQTRVPQGALSEFVASAIAEKFERMDEAKCAN